MSKKSEKFNEQEASAIESLREEKGWTFSGLIGSLQRIVEADYKNRSLNGKPSFDYIARILKGQRSANKNWRLLIANIFGLTPAEFTERCNLTAEKAKQKSIHVPHKQAVLPIDYWPHMTWSSSTTAERQIATKLYGLSKNGLKAHFKRALGEWKVPDGFAGYQELRQTAWEQFTANFQRMKKEPPNPEPLWHVSRLNMVNESTIAIDLKLTDYQDVLVTSSLRGLNKGVQVADGRTITIQEWLAEHWIPGNVEQPIIPCARQLVVNLLVLTKDNEVINGLQGPDNPDSSNSWATGVSRLVYPKTDSDSYGIPNLEKAGTGACIRELGIPISSDQIKWVTLAAGLKLGSFTFFGVVATGYDKEQIRVMFDENRKLYIRNNLGHEVVDIEFVLISAEAIANRLRIQNFRPYMELGLALLLWLQNEAVIKIQR